MAEETQVRKNRMHCLDATGDLVSEWDPTVEVEVEKARKDWEEWSQKPGYAAFRTDVDPPELIHEFNPNAGRVVFMQQKMVGG